MQVSHECVLDLFRLGLDNGHSFVEFIEELVAQLVGFGHVGFRVGRGSLEIGKRGFDEFRVARVGDVDGLGAVGVLFDRFDRIRDYGVGLEVLQPL